jgi:large subunit ribosomal protein L30
MAKVKVTQIKSDIGRPQDQRLTLKALGLGKLHATVEHENTPQIQGMLNKIVHLITVSE